MKNDFVLSEAHIGHLQRLRVSQRTVWEEKDFADNLIKKEETAEENTALMADFFTVITIGRSCSGSSLKASWISRCPLGPCFG